MNAQNTWWVDNLKLIVNGVLQDLTQGDTVDVSQGEGRLFVKGPSWTRSALVARSGGKTLVSFRGRTFVVEKPTARRASAEVSNGELCAPMPGLIIEVLVRVGDTVLQGDRLLILEAMKMQQPVVAPFNGAVRDVLVKLGDQVEEGTRLAIVEADK